MHAAQYHTMSLRAVAEAVTSGYATAREVALHFIERVERSNPALNAIVQFDAERVLGEAAAVDARVRAGDRLPLAGVPITIKDNLWVEGYRITQGSRVFDDFVAPHDAWVVARLRALGAVVLGITNCSEFACKGVTTNLVYGATRHPLDPALTPGGSSGGAAAALAAGLGLAAIGTDAGGSTRRPAAHCGLVGYKPSTGVVPHPWGFAEPNYGLSVIGLFTRDVGDCAWLFDLLQAYDAADPAGVPIDAGIRACDTLDAALPTDLRIAWTPDLGCDFAVDRDVLDAMKHAVSRLRDAGWNIESASPAWPACAREYPLLVLQQAGLHALYGDRLHRDPSVFDPVLAEQIAAGAGQPPEAIGNALRLREQIGAALSRFWDRYDLLLCPTTPVTAWPLEQLGPPVIGGRPATARGHAAFTPLFNYCGVPAISVPAGTVRGLPVGLQLAAPRYEDARLLQAASGAEAVLR
ncbi:amidase [Paracidovorax citrulli]